MPNGRIIDFRALFLCIGNTLLNLHSEIVTQATVDLDGCCHPLRKKFFYCVCNYNVEQFVDSNAYGVPSQLALFKEFTDNYRYDGYNYPLQGYDSPIFFISLIVFKWHVRRHSPFLAFSCDHEGLQSLYQLLVWEGGEVGGWVFTEAFRNSFLQEYESTRGCLLAWAYPVWIEQECP